METKDITVSELTTNEPVKTSSSKDLITDYWKRFKIKKNKGKDFIAFDTYRQSLGGRGIWGTKIFFRALMELNFIRECSEEDDIKSKYCPTEHAAEKYESLFCYTEDGELWGLSETELDYFDELIFPSLISMARRLEKIFKQEKS